MNFIYSDTHEVLWETFSVEVYCFMSGKSTSLKILEDVLIQAIIKDVRGGMRAPKIETPSRQRTPPPEATATRRSEHRTEERQTFSLHSQRDVNITIPYRYFCRMRAVFWKKKVISYSLISVSSHRSNVLRFKLNEKFKTLALWISLSFKNCILLSSINGFGHVSYICTFHIELNFNEFDFHTNL